MNANNILNTINASNFVEMFSILISLILGIMASAISYKNSKKLKEMEAYKHSLKMKELKIDTRYKNNQDLIEEVHMFLTNMKNLSCNSECYLFREGEDKKKKYTEVIIEARESLIWVRKKVNILSVYMDRSIYCDIIKLFDLAYEWLKSIDVKNYDDFLENIWKKEILEVEEKALNIIERIQNDNEQIIEN